jgi:hypothetical protein
MKISNSSKKFETTHKDGQDSIDKDFTLEREDQNSIHQKNQGYTY